MRNSSWLRFGLTSLMAGSAIFGAVLVACSDDDKPAGVTPTPDSGTPDTGNPDTQDSGTPDSGPKPQAARLQVVNAATDMGPDNELGMLRFCYEVAGIFPLPPIPDTKSSDDFPYPGVPIGAGGVADTTGTPLETLSITPYLMNAKTLADRGIVKGDAGVSGVSCTAIMGADKDAGGQGPLVEGVDFWKMPPIEANTLKNDKSYILVLTGCPSNSTAAEKCGDGFTASENPGNGNLKITVFEVDRATPIDPAKIGTQFIHASPAGALALAEAGGVVPGYTDSAKANFKAATADGGTVDVNKQTPLIQIDGVNVATDHFTANPALADLSLPLQQIQAFSFGANVPDGGAYRNGAAFTFIAIGDPEAPATVGDKPNTKKFHYIALPNDPTPKVYK